MLFFSAWISIIHEEEEEEEEKLSNDDVLCSGPFLIEFFLEASRKLFTN